MSENRPLLSHRRRLYHLADVYDRAVIRAWTTRDVDGMEDEHRSALKALEVAPEATGPGWPRPSGG